MCSSSGGSSRCAWHRKRAELPLRPAPTRARSTDCSVRALHAFWYPNRQLRMCPSRQVARAHSSSANAHARRRRPPPPRAPPFSFTQPPACAHPRAMAAPQRKDDPTLPPPWQALLGARPPHGRRMPLLLPPPRRLASQRTAGLRGRRAQPPMRAACTRVRRAIHRCVRGRCPQAADAMRRCSCARGCVLRVCAWPLSALSAAQIPTPATRITGTPTPA
jgi:hypothetical protein